MGDYETYIGLFTLLDINEEYFVAIKSTLHSVMYQFNITIEDIHEHNDSKSRLRFRREMRKHVMASIRLYYVIRQASPMAGMGACQVEDK